jgi:DNA polymerase-3 subunit delta
VSKSSRKQPSGLNFETFRTRVKERDIEPLYLFLGEETYRQERALELLFESLDEAGRAFNISIFNIGSEGSSGVKTTIADAIDAANQLPMMSARRIVVVRDFDKLKEEEQEIACGYLEHPSPTTTIVFQAVRLDKRRKLTTALTTSCTVVSFELLKEEDAKKWANKLLEKIECTIQPRALDKLIGFVGTALTGLQNELNKLAAWAGSDREITVAAVESLVSRNEEHTNWELWDAIVENNRVKALRLMDRLLHDGEPVMVNGSLGALYRRMLSAKEMLMRGASPSEFARAAGGPPYKLNAFRSKLTSMPRERIVHGIRRIAEVDDAIKNSVGTPRLQLQYLIAELTQPARGDAGLRRSSGSRSR